MNIEEIRNNIIKLENEIMQLRTQKNKLVKKLANYKWREKTKPPLKDKTKTLAYQTIGKRRKDFTAEDLKAYNKVCQQQSRAKKKQKEE